MFVGLNHCWSVQFVVDDFDFNLVILFLSSLVSFRTVYAWMALGVGSNISTALCVEGGLIHKAWSRMMVGKFDQLVGACSILHLEGYMEFIFCIFFFTTDYLVHSWLILCKTNIKPFKSAVGKPSGPHREHRVNTTVWHENWRRKPKCDVCLFFKLFRSCVIYVVLGAPVIRYWNMI